MLDHDDTEGGVVSTPEEAKPDPKIMCKKRPKCTIAALPSAICVLLVGSIASCDVPAFS